MYVGVTSRVSGSAVDPRDPMVSGERPSRGLDSPEDQRSSRRTSIPKGDFISQIYFSITLSCFPIHVSWYSQAVYHVTAPWGWQSKADGAGAFVHRLGLSRNLPVAGKCHLLSFKEGTSDSAPGEGAWRRGHDDRGLGSGFVRSWHSDFPSVDLLCVLRGWMVPRLLGLLGRGFVVVSPKRASEPLEAGSPVRRNQGDRTGLRRGLSKRLPCCRHLCRCQIALRFTAGLPRRREQKPSPAGREHAWAGALRERHGHRGRGAGRRPWLSRPPVAGCRVGLRLRTRDRTGEGWVTRPLTSLSPFSPPGG